MTAGQLILRFRSNIRLFPALAAATLISGVAVFLTLVAIVGFASRSLWLGIGAALAAFAIDCVASFMLVLVISRHPEAFASMQRLADMAAKYFSGAVAEPEDENLDEDLDEEEPDEEEEPEETAVVEPVSELSDEETAPGILSQQEIESAILTAMECEAWLLPGEIAARANIHFETVKRALPLLEVRGLIRKGISGAYIINEPTGENAN